MKIRLLTFLILGLSALPLSAQQKAPQLIYHGHSFFEVRSSKGTTLVMDPHKMIDSYGIVKGLKADVATLSHPHNDHTQITALENPKEVKVIPGFKGGGRTADWNIVDMKFKDMRIRSVGVYHDESKGLERGINTVFIVEVDGWTICHLGDLGHTLTKKQIKKIGKIDVLMIPIGGIYTINGSDAKKVVKQLKPKEFILPIHYGTPAFTGLLDEEEFLDGNPHKVVRVKDNRLLLNRSANRPRPLVLMLHYWPRNKLKRESD